MEGKEFGELVERLLAERKRDPDFKNPDEEAVQALIGKAIARMRAARFAILGQTEFGDPNHNLQVADFYLSLARGDSTPLETGSEG